MRQSSSHNQSQMAAAARWASIASTISLEMALPTLFGYWLDGQWGTKPWLVTIGAILGLITGIAHSIDLLKKMEQEQKRMDGTKDEKKNGR